MNQKGISSILIILIIVGVLVIGGTVWYYQKTIQSLPPPVSQTPAPPDETADWKTFRNESNGYEFKYPANILEVVTANTIQHTLKNFHRYSAKDGSDLGLANDIVISFIKGAGECKTIESSLKEIAVPFTSSNIKGLKYETGAEGEGVIYYCIKNNENKTIFLIKRWFLHSAYSTDLSKQPDFKSDQEQETIANQILSTFKFISPKNCDLYEMPMTEEQIRECTCPDGYKKFNRLSGAYCATDSRKPCSAHTDCPKGEHCISDDGKNWFCTGQFAGCYFNDPEHPTVRFCAD